MLLLSTKQALRGEVLRLSEQVKWARFGHRGEQSEPGYAREDVAREAAG